MNLEAHQTLHYIIMLLFYNIGELLAILVGAHLAAQSKINAVRSIWDYMRLRWIQLWARIFLCNCTFLLVWENPAVMSLERFMPTLAVHLGVAGILGWLSDSVYDKALAVILPGINKEIPAVPDASTPSDKA